MMELDKPTDYPPGSSAKLELMRARFEAGLPIFHPLDSRRVSLQQASGHTASFKFDPQIVYLAAVQARASKLEAIRHALQA